MRIGFLLVVLIAAAAVGYAVFRVWDEQSAPPIVISDAAAARPIVIDLRGAVAAPGVYELPPGARMQDAVAAGGGLAADADLSTVNLARQLRDGEVVAIAVIPDAGDSPPPSAALEDSAAGAEARPARININTATTAELDGLPGIGEVMAGRIIAFREEHGPYRSVDDLIHVDGISARTIDSFRDHVTTAP